MGALLYFTSGIGLTSIRDSSFDSNQVASMLRLYGMTWVTNYTKWLNGYRVLDVQLINYPRTTREVYFRDLPQWKAAAQVGTLAQ